MPDEIGILMRIQSKRCGLCKKKTNLGDKHLRRDHGIEVQKDVWLKKCSEKEQVEEVVKYINEVLSRIEGWAEEWV